MTPRQPGVRSVVYTALFGSYEELVEQPMAGESRDVDFVCFSDVERKSASWRVVVVDLPVISDPARSARLIKIQGHEELRPYDEWLWIDNRVVLTAPPTELLKSWLQDCDLAIPLHDHRISVGQEYQAVLRAGFDSSYRVREELHVLQQDRPSVLSEPPLWTGLIARRPTEAVDRWASLWLSLVILYSRRDQLSVNYAVARSGIELNAVSIANRCSQWHTWLTVDELPKDAVARFTASSGFRYRLRDYLFDQLLVSPLGRRVRKARRSLL
jgi:Protein of unknown function (DUF616)